MTNEQTPPEEGRPAAELVAAEAMQKALEPYRDATRTINQVLGGSTLASLQANSAILEIGTRNARAISSVFEQSGLRMLQEQAARNAEALQGVTKAFQQQAAMNLDLVSALLRPQKELAEALAGWRNFNAGFAMAAVDFTPADLGLRLGTYDWGLARLFANDMSAVLRAWGSAPFDAQALPEQSITRAVEVLEEVDAAPPVDLADTVELPDAQALLSPVLDEELEALAASVDDAVPATDPISRAKKRAVLGASVFATLISWYVFVPGERDKTVQVIELIAFASEIARRFFPDDE